MNGEQHVNIWFLMKMQTGHKENVMFSFQTSLIITKSCALSVETPAAYREHPCLSTARALSTTVRLRLLTWETHNCSSETIHCLSMDIQPLLQVFKGIYDLWWCVTVCVCVGWLQSHFVQQQLCWHTGWLSGGAASLPGPRPLYGLFFLVTLTVPLKS